MLVDKPLKLFSLNSNIPLAKQVAKSLGVELSKCSVKKFSDGEVSINIEESVRGCEVFVIQSTSGPVNDNLMTLLIMIDALKRASVDTINVVIPYYGYARQDRKARSREPITAKLVANLIEKSGADRVITMDLHAGQIQGYFDIPVDHLSAIKPLADFFKDELKDEDKKDMVVVSPDLGGVTRARNFSNYLDLPIAILEKRRPRPNVSEVMNVIGDIEGKTCIIVDDIIDTAGTITNAANALIAKGAKKVYITASHGVFSGKAIENIANSKVEKCVVTDTIPQEKNLGGKIEVVSVAQYFAKAIDRINNNRPVSMLFDGR